jgi:hypothetical protein
VFQAGAQPLGIPGAGGGFCGSWGVGLFDADGVDVASVLVSPENNFTIPCTIPVAIAVAVGTTRAAAIGSVPGGAPNPGIPPATAPAAAPTAISSIVVAALF